MISPNNGDDFLRHEFGFPFSIFLGGVQGSSNDVISNIQRYRERHVVKLFKSTYTSIPNLSYKNRFEKSTNKFVLPRSTKELSLTYS